MKILKNIIAKLIFILFLIVNGCTSCSLSSLIEDETITIASYNVENLFDDVKNGNEYSDYDPESGSWDSDKYHRKLLAISRVIKSFSNKGADILCLQEIENENVLDTLTNVYCKNLNYKYTFIPHYNKTSTNTAIVSKYPFENVLSHSSGNENMRFILEAKISINGKSIYVFNNHWKSKRGGEECTEDERIASAWAVKRRIIEIQDINPMADIVVTGDLN